MGTGTQGLELSSAAFTGHKLGDLVEVEKPGEKPTSKCNASAIGRDLTYYA